MKKLTALFLASLLFLGSAGISTVQAAEFKAGEEVVIPEGTQNLEDVYLFGGNIRVNAPVTNDAVVAGGDITLNEDVTGSIMAAGGNININGTTGNTIRVAGGNIRIDGPITRDLVITGGSVTVTQNATIGKDLVFNGGNLVLEGPVRGKVLVNGGNATINSQIGGNVEGHIEKLIIGSNARIGGDLKYKSPEKATIADGAVITGQTNYTPYERDQKQEEHAREFITAGTIYKLVADIILTVLFIYFFAKALTSVLTRFTAKPVENGAIGFAFIVLFPVAALISLILVWLGIAGLLSYALILLISIFVVKVFLGWLVMRWWEKRNNKQYILDWKAGIIGPILLFLIAAIPFIGWLAAAILFFIATGAVFMELIGLMRHQKALPTKSVAKKK